MAENTTMKIMKFECEFKKVMAYYSHIWILRLDYQFAKMVHVDTKEDLGIKRWNSEIKSNFNEKNCLCK